MSSTVKSNWGWVLVEWNGCTFQPETMKPLIKIHLTKNPDPYVRSKAGRGSFQPRDGHKILIGKWVEHPETIEYDTHEMFEEYRDWYTGCGFSKKEYFTVEITKIHLFLKHIPGEWFDPKKDYSIIEDSTITVEEFTDEDEMKTESVISTEYIRKKYDHESTTSENFHCKEKREQESFKQRRRRAQGFENPKYKLAVECMNGSKTTEWNLSRLSWVLIRTDYEWLTPDIKSFLKDCF